VLDDIVRYKSDGEPGEYLGTDLQDSGDSTHFTWRGEGFLALFPTEFYVAHVDPAGRFVIVYYTDTVISEDAVDVLAKSATPDAATIRDAVKVLKSDPLLRDRAKGLRRIPLDGKELM
jgi:hypothetical protein